MGNRLRELRKQRGLTAWKLGIESGVNQVSIYEYESGRVKPKLETAQRLARALGVSVDELFPIEETA